MNGADVFVKSLVNEGVEYVFGYPGVAICPFFDAILNTDIKTILVRQEQNAAHEASGYARVSGKVGVAVTTSGPGATNLITGIATAFADSIPIVCITGQVDTDLIGGDVFQEADICGACESFVKFSYSVRKASDIPRIVKEAFYIANTGRKGPVLIDLPQDVQMQNVSRFEWPEEVNIRTYKPTVEGHAVQIRKVIKSLQKAKRPVICIGGGVHLSGAEKEVCSFAEKHEIPMVSTMMGVSTIPTRHPLYYGMIGNNGNKYGNRAMNEADMIIMVGARVADRTIRNPNLVLGDKVLVHIDVDPAEIGKNAGPTIPLVGDIKSIFTAFNDMDFHSDYTDWIDVLDGYKDETKNAIRNKRFEEDVKHKKTVDPPTFMRHLSLAMDDDSIYVADVGQNQLWSVQNYVQRKGRFLTSGGMGTMGYALPAAMGAKLADPDRQVVAVAGDGGFQMTMMELSTMGEYGIPVKIVVISNNTLGLVRQHQHLKYHDRWSVTTLGGGPDFEKLTQAYGIRYLRLSDNRNMDEVIEQFLAGNDSAFLEVIVDPDEVV